MFPSSLYDHFWGFWTKRGTSVGTGSGPEWGHCVKERSARDVFVLLSLPHPPAFPFRRFKEPLLHFILPTRHSRVKLQRIILTVRRQSAHFRWTHPSRARSQTHAPYLQKTSIEMRYARRRCVVRLGLAREIWGDMMSCSSCSFDYVQSIYQ